MLVVAGISAVSFPSKAAVIQAGDLILGFRATGGSGNTNTLMIDLGSASSLYKGGSTNANVASIGTLLSTTFGSSWNTRSDLYYGIAAVNDTSSFTGGNVAGDPHRTAYLSVGQTGTPTLGIKQSTAPSVASASYAGTANSINALTTTFAGIDTTGTGSAVAGVGANTWASANVGDPNASSPTALNSFGLGYGIETSFSGGASTHALDLYRVLLTAGTASPSSGVFQGTFNITSSGTVGFTGVTSVPEPSRVIFAGLGLGALLLRRRRNLKA
jgi:hypothetical protein